VAAHAAEAQARQRRLERGRYPFVDRELDELGAEARRPWRQGDDALLPAARSRLQLIE